MKNELIKQQPQKQAKWKFIDDSLFKLVIETKTGAKINRFSTDWKNKYATKRCRIYGLAKMKNKFDFIRFNGIKGKMIKIYQATIFERAYSKPILKWSHYEHRWLTLEQWDVMIDGIKDERSLLRLWVRYENGLSESYFSNEKRNGDFEKAICELQLIMFDLRTKPCNILYNSIYFVGKDQKSVGYFNLENEGAHTITKPDYVTLRIEKEKALLRMWVVFKNEKEDEDHFSDQKKDGDFDIALSELQAIVVDYKDKAIEVALARVYFVGKDERCIVKFNNDCKGDYEILEPDYIKEKVSKNQISQK